MTISSNARLGKGFLIQRGDGGAPETFTTVAEVQDVDGPSFSAESVDVTNQDSPNFWKEFIPGLKDGGEVTFDVNFLPDDATQDATTGVIADFNNRTCRNWRIAFPTPSSKTWTFPAFVTGVEPSHPIEDRATASLTLKVAGEPTLA